MSSTDDEIERDWRETGDTLETPWRLSVRARFFYLVLKMLYRLNYLFTNLLTPGFVISSGLKPKRSTIFSTSAFPFLGALRQAVIRRRGFARSLYEMVPLD